MRLPSVAICLIVFLPAHFAMADNAFPASLYGEMGDCYAPPEPFGDKLSKSDPLYEAARQEHQEYLEDLEDYVNCLDRERGAALGDLRSSFNLFVENFGDDAVLRYKNDRGASE
jgi:hypothetical protein